MSDSRAGGGETITRCADEPQQPSAAEVRAQLDRILASRCFQQAGRASHFLRFVVEQTLAGGGQRLKGYTIGVEVFGRPADFDAQSDALVRVEAGRLRRRLVEYYASEGVGDPVRIDLPRGSYAVEYRAVAPSAVPAAPPPPPAAEAPPASNPFPWRRVAGVLAVLLVAAAAAIVWELAALRHVTKELEALGEPPQPTEWPRIVVVPFENLGADETLDVVAASMTEEIMVRLDELDLFVIASQSSWYGASHDKGAVLRSANGYVLTGSVRGTVTDARITIRLIEAASGAQLWTTAYDEPLAMERLPALQEAVAREVAAIAAPYGPIFEAELARARRSAHEPRLRDCLATYYDFRRRFIQTVHEEALACFQSVGKRQPNLAAVWSGIAMLHVDRFSSTLGLTGEAGLAAARAATDKALQLDPNDFLANLALARVQFLDNDPKFRESIERTVRLRPNSAQAFAQAGFMLTISGDAAQGLLMVQRAQALSKAPLGLYHLAYAVAYLSDQQYPEAFRSVLQVDARNWVFAQVVIAAAAAHVGRLDVAREAAERVREMYPEFEFEALGNFERGRFDRGFHEALVTGLAAAGLQLRDPHVPISGG
jgi:adenylate cyclase